MSEQKKYVYFFGAGQTEGNANMRELLVGKGANLAISFDFSNVQ